MDLIEIEHEMRATAAKLAAVALSLADETGTYQQLRQATHLGTVAVRLRLLADSVTLDV